VPEIEVTVVVVMVKISMIVETVVLVKITTMIRNTKIDNIKELVSIYESSIKFDLHVM
jgi:hypothetical protein